MGYKLLSKVSLVFLVALCLYVLSDSFGVVIAAQEVNDQGEIILLTISPPPSNDGTLTLFSLNHPDQTSTIKLQSPGYPISGAWSPDGDVFVFIMITSTSEPGNPPSDIDIYSFKKENQSITQLTSTPNCPEIGLAWSPDSQWLYFSSFCREGQTTEFWKINMADGAPNRLGEVIWDATWAVWSPDLQYVALLAPRNFSDGTLYDEILVVSVDGKNQYPITDDAYPGYQLQQTTIAAWSPDSTTLTYSTHTQALETGVRNQLFQVRFDGIDRKLLYTSNPGLECNNPQWAPDGLNLAAICGGDVILIRNDGSEPENITSLQGGERTEYLAWSPGSDRITFLTSKPEGTRILKTYRFNEGKAYQIDDIQAIQSFGLFWAPVFETPPLSQAVITQASPLEISPEKTEVPVQSGINDADESIKSHETGKVNSFLSILLLASLIIGLLVYGLVRARQFSGPKISDMREVVPEPNLKTGARINAQPQLLEQGIQQIKQGSVQEGMDSLRYYLADDPENSYAWLWLGWAAGLRKDYRAAERCFIRSGRLGNIHAKEALVWLASQKRG